MVLTTAIPVPAQEWKQVSVNHGLVLKSRTVDGEPYSEVRIQTTTPVPVTKLASYLFGRYIDEPDPGIHRKVIQRVKDHAKWTDLIKTPIISDLCATTRMSLKTDSKNGNLEIEFASKDDWPQGKPSAACVPLRSRGSWLMKPTAGGTELTYTIFADPGGGLPAFFVRGALEDDAFKRVKRVITEAAK